MKYLLTQGNVSLIVAVAIAFIILAFIAGAEMIPILFIAAWHAGKDLFKLCKLAILAIGDYTVNKIKNASNIYNSWKQS